MATTKKTDSGKPAPKQSAARKPAAKKAAAKKTTAAKKPAAKKVAAPEAKAVKKVSAARSKAKAERKAPEKVPGRKERRGVVVSDGMDKTIVVRIDVAQKHERYGKVVRRSSKLHAHDEQNAAGVGDLVRVVETRPLSATKHWRLLEILEKAK
jgi:small subunit ribosomal protein S17